MYALSGFAPRRADRVVFGGNGDRFTDNAKHLFVTMAPDDRFRCVWITGRRSVRDQVRSLGFRSELRWSWRGTREVLRAGWVVYGAYPSDANFWLSRGARLLNLWHGIPFKAIEFDVDAGPLARVYRSRPWSPLRLAFVDRFRRPDFVVSPSSFLTERCFTSAFRVTTDRCLEVGYPRTDPLFIARSREEVRSAVGLGRQVVAAAQVVGYFPTWRDDGRDFLREAGFSFDELDGHLDGTGQFLVFKAHPNFAMRASTAHRWANIEVLDASVDLNEVLPLCDALVTDYSSVAFDYLLLDRPIVYFLPDHESYVEHRNLYFDVSEMTAGPVVTTASELYRLLAAGIKDEGPERRRELRDLVWGDYDGTASARIAEFIASAT